MPNKSKFTTEERVFMYQQSNRMSAAQVRALWREEFPDRQPPCENTINNTRRRFENTGSVNPSDQIQYPSRQISEEIEVQVCAAAENDHFVCENQIAEQVGISRSSVHNIWKRNQYHPYKLQKHQQLYLRLNDYERRMSFCESMMERIHAAERLNAHDILHRRICFSDESTFKLFKSPNPQQYRYRSREFPTAIYDVNSQYQGSLNVWVGMLDTTIIGPFFIEGNLNHESYLQMLRDNVVPAVRRHEVQNNIQAWFQQDGAGPHNPRIVRDYLEQEFPQRWIGLFSPHLSWPARSPDLTPLDYFYWGHIKNQLYDGQTVYTLETLQQRIIDLSNNIPGDFKRRAIDEFEERLGWCSLVQGGHFEHIQNSSININDLDAYINRQIENRIPLREIN